METQTLKGAVFLLLMIPVAIRYFIKTSNNDTRLTKIDYAMLVCKFSDRKIIMPLVPIVVDDLSTYPAPGRRVLCRIQHCDTKGIQEHFLVRVLEDDCDWRTADDQSELSYNWNVIAWRSET